MELLIFMETPGADIPSFSSLKNRVLLGTVCADLSSNRNEWSTR